jgi:hypothetical protein
MMATTGLVETVARIATGAARGRGAEVEISHTRRTVGDRGVGMSRKTIVVPG